MNEQEQKRIERMHTANKLWRIAALYGELYNSMNVLDDHLLLARVESMHEQTINMAEEYDKFYFGLYRGR